MDTEGNIFSLKKEPFSEDCIKESFVNKKQYILDSKKNSDNIKSQDEINQIRALIYDAIINNLKGTEVGQRGIDWCIEILLKNNQVKIEIKSR